ncbi:unnamed protein product, partial [Nesidiocoris tenuis]
MAPFLNMKFGLNYFFAKTRKPFPNRLGLESSKKFLKLQTKISVFKCSNKIREPGQLDGRGFRVTKKLGGGRCRSFFRSMTRKLQYYQRTVTTFLLRGLGVLK